MPRKIAATAAALALGLAGSAAWAHSIHIFAFPEGAARLCADSYFGGQAKVRGGRVVMAEASGEPLAEAVTDDRGRACFERPDPPRDLIFIVEASGGHRAEFRLPGATGSSAAGAAEPGLAGFGAAGGDSAEGARGYDARGGVLTAADLQKALAPIMMKLAEMESAQNSRIDFKDVVGGLGWLAGLAGAALWGARRRAPNRAEEEV